MRANAPIPALLALAACTSFQSTAWRTVAASFRSQRPLQARKKTTLAVSKMKPHEPLTARHYPIAQVRASKPSPPIQGRTPVILPSLYNKRGRLIVPPPLKGSHEILVHQNQVADRDGLDRIQNDEDLLDMRSEQPAGLFPSQQRAADRRPSARQSPLLPSLDRAVSCHSGPRPLRALPHPATGQLRRPHRRVPAASDAHQRQRSTSRR